MNAANVSFDVPPTGRTCRTYSERPVEPRRSGRQRRPPRGHVRAAACSSMITACADAVLAEPLFRADTVDGRDPRRSDQRHGESDIGDGARIAAVRVSRHTLLIAMGMSDLSAMALSRMDGPRRTPGTEVRRFARSAITSASPRTCGRMPMRRVGASTPPGWAIWMVPTRRHARGARR